MLFGFIGFFMIDDVRWFLRIVFVCIGFIGYLKESSFFSIGLLSIICIALYLLRCLDVAVVQNIL